MFVRRLRNSKLAASTRPSARFLPHANQIYLNNSVTNGPLKLLGPFAVSSSTGDPRVIEIMAPPSTSQVAFGVQYLPASELVKVPTYGRGNVLDKLQDNGTRYIRFQWVDYTNTTRYRIIPLAAFRDLMSASRPGVGVTKAAFGLIGASLAPGFSGTGEYLYVPDLSSLRPCGYASKHVSLMGWFEEKLPSEESAGREDALKVPLCPRGLLRDVVEYVHLSLPFWLLTIGGISKGKGLGVEFLVGVETEFILLTSTDPVTPAHNASWSASRALLSGSVAEKCLEDMADALQYGGIELQMYHAEAAPGQVWDSGSWMKCN